MMNTPKSKLIDKMKKEWPFTQNMTQDDLTELATRFVDICTLLTRIQTNLAAKSM